MDKPYCSCGRDPGELHKPYCNLLKRSVQGQGISGDSELTRLRAELAAVTQERDRLQHLHRNLQHLHRNLEAERVRLSDVVNLKNTQLTHAEEAKKLVAVQMMTLEEKADKFMWQVRDTCTRAEKAESQLTTSCEEGYRAGLERAAEVLQDESEKSAPCWCPDYDPSDGPKPEPCDCCNFIANVDDRLHAEASTLPRTYEQGAEEMRERAAEAIEAARLNVINDPARKNGYFEARQIIRALPIKEREGERENEAENRLGDRRDNRNCGHIRRSCKRVC